MDTARRCVVVEHSRRFWAFRITATMSDFALRIADKLSGDWSASNVASLLNDTIIDVRLLRVAP